MITELKARAKVVPLAELSPPEWNAVIPQILTCGIARGIVQNMAPHSPLQRLAALIIGTLPAKGQITHRDTVGKWIELLSSLDEVKSIVEIGTWSGRGSSQCIKRGVLSRRVPDRLHGDGGGPMYRRRGQ